MDPLGTRPLGRSGLQVTQLGFGGAPLGDFSARLPEPEAIATVEAAHAAGLTLFDTSPLYGHGLSEHRFGHVLRRKPRDGFVLSSKVGRYLRARPEHEIDRGWFAGGLNFEAVVDYSYDGAMRSFEQSLQRLGMNADRRAAHPRRRCLDPRRGGLRASFPHRHGGRLPGA